MSSAPSQELIDGSKPPPISAPGPAATSRSEKVGRGDRLRSVIVYLWGERSALLAAVVILTLIIVALAAIALGSRLLTWEALSALSSILAFSIGVVIFLYEAVVNAEARLPKRLSVYYLDPHEDVTRLVCQWAHLSGEGDMRAWGQQIGLQICDHKDIRHLDFTPFAELRRLGLEKQEGALVTHYQAVFRLRAVPPLIDSQLVAQEKLSGVKMAKVLMPRAGDKHGAVDILFDEAAKYQPVPSAES